MRYVVSIADKKYEVEIEDVRARPVIARIDGQEFIVDPEEQVRPAIQREPRESGTVSMQRQQPAPGLTANELTAPLPGTVIEIFVKAGDLIETGQVILIIEAMKMKNSIRSTRAGKVTELLVGAGQTVAHKQALVRFG